MPDDTWGGRDGLEWALAAVQERRKGYVLHRDYHEGRHRLAFATERFRQHFGQLFENMRDNLCAPVVEALLDRLEVIGWESPSNAGGSNGSPATAASALWAANQMALRQDRAHLEAARCADGFELVWPTAAGQVRIWPQEPTAMAVQYDEEDDPTRMVRATKVWERRDGYWRVNVYTPTTIERWISQGKRQGDAPQRAGYMVPYTGDEAGEEVPNTWGTVPVFHYPNGAEAGEWGRSELADVVPLQDALNKSVADLLVAGEFVALPQRVLIGVEADIDPETGTERKLDAGADRLWRVRNVNASATQFEPANLSGFLEVQEAFRLEISRVAGLPPHYLMLNKTGLAQAPSGQALTVLEQRLVHKANKRVAAWGDVRRRAMQLALRMQAGPNSTEVPDVTPVWADTDTVSELDNAELVEAKRRAGWSRRQALREAGKTEPELDAMDAELEDEQVAIGNAMLRQLDAGSVAVGAGGGAFGG